MTLSNPCLLPTSSNFMVLLFFIIVSETSVFLFVHFLNALQSGKGFSLPTMCKYLREGFIKKQST